MFSAGFYIFSFENKRGFKQNRGYQILLLKGLVELSEKDEL